MADMTLSVKILGDASSLSSAVDSAKAKLEQLYGKVNNPASGSGLVEIGGKIQSVGDKAISTGKTYTAAFTVPIVMGAKKAVKSYEDWESAFTGVMKTVDETATTTYDDLEKSIKQIAMETASSREEVAGVAEIAGQLGVSADNLADFTKTMVILGDTTNLSCEEAAMSLAKVMNVMGDAPDDVDNLASVIVDLGNNFATTEKDIVEMSERLAPYGRTVGLTTSEVMALSTAMSSVGIRSEAGGTAMGRVLSKIDNQVKKSGLMLKDYAKVAGMSVEDFSKLWESRPVEAFQKVVEGLHKVKEEGGNVHDVLDNLGLGGEVRVKSMMLSLAESGDLLSNTLDTATKAFDENTAATEEAEKRYATFEAKISQTKEHIKAAGDVIAEQLLPHILKLLDGVQKVTDAFVNLSPEQQKFIVAIGGIVAVIGPLLFLFGHLSKSLGGLFVSFGGIIEKGGILGKTLGFLLSPLGLVTGALAVLVGGFIAAARAPDTLGKALLEFINKAGAKFVKFIQDLPTKLAAMSKNLGVDLFENALKGEKSGQFVAKFITTVSQVYTAIRQAMIDNAPAIIAGISQLIQEIGLHLQQNASQIFEIAKAMFGAIADAITAILPAVVEALTGLIEILVPILVEMAPLLLNAAVQLFTAMVEAITQVLPQIIEAIGAVIPVIANSLVTLAPLLIDAGIQLFLALVEAVVTVLPQIIDAVVNIIPNIVDAIITALPLLLDAGIQLFLALVEALPIVLPQILDALATIIPKLVDVLITAMPIFLDGAVKFFTAFIEALPIILPQLLEALGKLVFEVGEKLIEHIPDLLKAAANLFGAIVTAFINMHLAVIEEVLKFIVDFGKKFVDGIEKKIDNLDEWLGDAWENIKTTAGEAWDGLVEVVTDPIDAIKKAWNKLVDLLTTPIKIPKIDLPEIEIEGEFSLDPPQVPRLKWGGWHAKGALFSKPSVIGVGEAGPEAVAPIDKLKAYVAEAVTNARSATMDYTAIDSLADAIATGFAMQSAGQQGGEYHFTVELGGARVAEKIFTLNKEGEMIMQGA